MLVHAEFCKVCCHILGLAVVMNYVNAGSEPLAEISSELTSFDFDRVFRTEYSGIARVIARVVGDSGCAEELAAEVFWKLSRTPNAQGSNSSGWLYRTATRMALDELRKQLRRKKYEALFSRSKATRTPEELHLEKEEQQRVRVVLARLKKTHAQMLVLRSHGCSYQEVARALDLNPASIGTLLRRAEEAFRKEYVRWYGQNE
jgi:RNA polymerase sigma-70 factor (ECF subfamily)